MLTSNTETSRKLDDVTISLRELSLYCQGAKDVQTINEALKLTGYKESSTLMRLRIAILIRHRINPFGTTSKIFRSSNDIDLALSGFNPISPIKANSYIAQSTSPSGDLGILSGITLELLKHVSRGTPEYRDRIANEWTHANKPNQDLMTIDLSEEEKSELECELDTLEELLKNERKEVSQRHSWIVKDFYSQLLTGETNLRTNHQPQNRSKDNPSYRLSLSSLFDHCSECTNFLCTSLLDKLRLIHISHKAQDML